MPPEKTPKPDKKPARLLVPLPKEQEELLRKTAKLASYTQAELLTAISESRAFANARRKPVCAKSQTSPCA